jgi:hypothetical protein
MPEYLVDRFCQGLPAAGGGSQTTTSVLEELLNALAVMWSGCDDDTGRELHRQRLRFNIQYFSYRVSNSGTSGLIRL